VVLAHRLPLQGEWQPADQQHRELRWFTVADLLAEPAVHDNVKAYFRP